jgi:hypothetical protein
LYRYTVAVMIGGAFVVGGRKAKKAARTIQMHDLHDINGMQPSEADNVATRSSS